MVDKIIEQKILNLYASRTFTERQLAEIYEVSVDEVRDVVCKTYFYGIKKKRSDYNENKTKI